MTTALERLNQILEYVGNPSVTGFSKSINIKPANFQSIKKGTQKTFAYESAYAINKYYPEINTHWIMTGSGQMLQPEHNTLMQRKIPDNLQKELVNVGLRLQELQIKNKIYNDATFAQIIGITEKRYIEIVGKNKIPETDELIAIVQNFNVSIDWLLFGEDSQHSQSHKPIISKEEMNFLNEIIKKLNQQF